MALGDQDSQPKIRQFSSGATRDQNEDKLNYTGFNSPYVQKRFAEYMHKNRTASDGSRRAADNWQKGIPRQAYMESLERHVMEFKLEHQKELDLARATRDRVYAPADVNRPLQEDLLCAIIFNAQGMLFEILRGTPIIEEKEAA